MLLVLQAVAPFGLTPALQAVGWASGFIADLLPSDGYSKGI